MRKVLLLLAIGVFTAGCTSLTKLKTPDLKVVGVSFLGGGACMAASMPGS